MTDKQEVDAGVNLRVVFESPYGFVTDLGHSLPIQTSGEIAVTFLPRYGVWRKARGARKYEVVHVTDDISEARALAEKKEYESC